MIWLIPKWTSTLETEEIPTSEMPVTTYKTRKPNNHKITTEKFPVIINLPQNSSDNLILTYTSITDSLTSFNINNQW